jgi:hypothetical protein
VISFIILAFFSHLRNLKPGHDLDCLKFKGHPLKVKEISMTAEQWL